MKQMTAKTKQLGFFTFGLGLGLIILFGSSAAVVSSSAEIQSGSAGQESGKKYESTEVVTNKLVI